MTAGSPTDQPVPFVRTHHGTQSPEISVVINNYNYAQFLAEAVDSALYQTLPFNEIIVVDDGSTDFSRSIIAGYGTRVISVFQANQGQAAALNHGLQFVHADYVIFLDADDRLEHSAAQKVLQAFTAHPDAVKIQYRMAVINACGKKTGVEKPAAHLSMPCGNLRQEALAFPFDIPWMPTSGNAFAVAAISEILPIPEEAYTPVGADWYLTQCTNLLGESVFLNEVLACYRVHGSNHYEIDPSAGYMNQIRQSIHFASNTIQYLKKIAQQLNIEPIPEDILAVSFVANRMISLRLEPQSHPIQSDSRWKLLSLGIKASGRRFDIPLLRRMVFRLWFLLMALSPRRLAESLSIWFIFPDKRPRLIILK
jgi:glycosyltransferase involved in cell wall biosynthesis